MHGTGDYTITDLADCSTSPDPPSTAPSQPWKLLLRNAAADNALSYFAFGSASGVSERRRAVSELLLAVPDEVAWCWAKAEYRRRRIESIADVRNVWPIRNSAKPERHGRPAGPRVHFLKLDATGYPRVEHRVTVVTV
jgi:hypothetical protein